MGNRPRMVEGATNAIHHGAQRASNRTLLPFLLFILLAALLPPEALCSEDDDGSNGSGEVIPEQLPVNDRQIDDVVEELLVRQQEGDKDNEVDSKLRPLLQLHGKTRRSPSNFAYSKRLKDSMRLGKRQTPMVRERMRLGKRSVDEQSNYAWQEDSADDQLAEMEPWEEKDLQDMLRHQLYGKRDGGDDPMRFEKKSMADSMRLGKKSLDNSMRLGKRPMGDSMRLGRRSPGNSMRLGKRAMGDSMRLGKRESWAAEDPWMQDHEPNGVEDYDVDKRAFGDSIRLGKRSRSSSLDGKDIEGGNIQKPWWYLQPKAHFIHRN